MGTYQIVSNRAEMQQTPATAEKLLDMLLYRHRMLLHARKSKNPGAFKDRNNRAGNTFFVDHELVKGTLIKGFDYYGALNNPFAKAVYIMFMVMGVLPGL